MQVKMQIRIAIYAAPSGYGIVVYHTQIQAHYELKQPSAPRAPYTGSTAQQKPGFPFGTLLQNRIRTLKSDSNQLSAHITTMVRDQTSSTSFRYDHVRQGLESRF
jgi:hypothetical protein